jgi:type II secretory pathway pseudopilin PulG
MINSMRGFTLIETLVAVLLLVTAIAGPLTLASKGLSSAVIARDQLNAFYLAQDAVEYVRFVRDSNKLASASWLTGLTNCTGADGCIVDSLGNDADAATGGIQPVVACSGACPVIQKHNAGSNQVYYSYTLGTRTPQQFIRTVRITNTTVTEAVLTVTVQWRAMSGVQRSISVRENLFDWQ